MLQDSQYHDLVDILDLPQNDFVIQGSIPSKKVGHD